MISNRKEVAEKLNDFFTEAVAKLEIEPDLPVSTNTPICNNIHEIIEKYKYHPSITKIKEIVGECNKFHFMDVSSQVFEKEIKNFDTKKASVENDMPTKILIGSSEIVTIYLRDIYNDSKNQQDFRFSLKLADVIPIPKTKEKIVRKDFCPVSLLPIISKLFEKVIFLNDIFYFTKNAKIANYAGDNTPNTIGDSIDNLLKTLEIEISVLLQWFQLNEMKSNEGKCHLLVANNTEVSVTQRR